MHFICNGDAVVIYGDQHDAALQASCDPLDAAVHWRAGEVAQVVDGVAVADGLVPVGDQPSRPSRSGA
jgi:hypothetical protein